MKDFEISNLLFTDTEQYLEVKKITIHEKYSPDSDEYDIAIIELASPAKPTDHVVPACFPSPMAELAEGSKCYITGKMVSVHNVIGIEDLTLGFRPIMNLCTIGRSQKSVF